MGWSASEELLAQETCFCFSDTVPLRCRCLSIVSAGLSLTSETVSFSASSLLNVHRFTALLLSQTCCTAAHMAAT